RKQLCTASRRKSNFHSVGVIISFFYWCAEYCEIHSFPTRRSSDLGIDTKRIQVVDKSGMFASIFIDTEETTFDLSDQPLDEAKEDRKSTRLNSSHVKISYAVFCLKKKTKINISVVKTWNYSEGTIF